MQTNRTGVDTSELNINKETAGSDKTTTTVGFKKTDVGYRSRWKSGLQRNCEKGNGGGWEDTALSDGTGTVAWSAANASAAHAN